MLKKDSASPSHACAFDPSSIRKKAVTAVQPECVLPSCAILERCASTMWKVLFSTSGIANPRLLASVSRKCYTRNR